MKWSVDIIIPAYRPGEDFKRLIGMLEKQSVHYERLIIILTASDKEAECDELRAMIKGLMKDPGRLIFRCIGKSEFDHAATRHLGAELSQAERFICMTDDAVPCNEYFVGELMKALDKDPGIAAVYARQLPKEDADEAERFARAFNYPEGSLLRTSRDIETLGVRAYFLSNVSAAYRKDIYTELGGFEAPAIFNEDMVYAAAALRAGYSIGYSAEALVMHSHNYGPLRQLHRNFDLGMSQAMHPEVFRAVSSESEGVRFVRASISHLSRTGHVGAVPGFICCSGCKWVGYRLGKSYRKLPRSLVLWLTADRNSAERILSGGLSDGGGSER